MLDPSVHLAGDDGHFGPIMPPTTQAGTAGMAVDGALREERASIAVHFPGERELLAVDDGVGHRDAILVGRLDRRRLDGLRGSALHRRHHLLREREVDDLPHRPGGLGGGIGIGGGLDDRLGDGIGILRLLSLVRQPHKSEHHRIAAVGAGVLRHRRDHHGHEPTVDARDDDAQGVSVDREDGILEVDGRRGEARTAVATGDPGHCCFPFAGGILFGF